MLHDCDIKSIPEKFTSEFIAERTRLVKIRVKLLCILALVIYFVANVLGLIFDPMEFNRGEIPIIIQLIICSIMILLINSRVSTLKIAKLNAFFFAFIIATIITRLNILYHPYMGESASIYMFVMFLVSFTIPWAPFDVLLITLLHIFSYVNLYLYASKAFPDFTSEHFNHTNLTNGIIFLVMGFILAAVVRKKEGERDVENFLLYKDIEEKNLRIQRELEFAGKIHKTLIPKSITTDIVDIAVTYYPMGVVGGDLAKVHFIGKDKMIFFISDVTGHGVSAALLVNRLHAEFEGCVSSEDGPASLLNSINEFIIKDFEGTSMYLTAFCCFLDLRKKELIYSNCGHPTQYLYRSKDNKIVKLDPISTMLGISFAKNDFPEKKIQFSSGDRIMLFTDGMIESQDPSGKEFGLEGLESFIFSNHAENVESFNQKLMSELKAYTDNIFTDDVFAMTAMIK